MGSGLFANAKNAMDCSGVREIPQSNNNVLRIYSESVRLGVLYKAPFCRSDFINCENSQWVKCGHGNTQLESFGSCSFALSRAHCLKWLTSVPLYDSIRQPLEQNLDFPLYDSCWRYLISIYNFYLIMLCIYILHCYPNTQQTLIHCNKCKWTVVNK